MYFVNKINFEIFEKFVINKIKNFRTFISDKIIIL